MIAGHRWEYSPVLREYFCAPLPVGGVESRQWCIGCNAKVSDLELCHKKISKSDKAFLQIALDTLASNKGFEPLEAGTLKAGLYLQRNHH